MSGTGSEAGYDDLVESLEARAAQRRGDGTYPAGVDAALRADVEHRLRDAATHTTALRAAVAELIDLGPFEVRSYRGSNRLKAIYARVVDKAIGHALADIVRQMEAHRVAVERVLHAIIEDAEARRADDEP